MDNDINNYDAIREDGNYSELPDSGDAVNSEYNELTEMGNTYNTASSDSQLAVHTHSPRCVNKPFNNQTINLLYY